MVAEDTEPGHCGQRGQQAVSVSHGGVKIFSSGISEIPRDNDGIAPHSLQAGDKGIGKIRIQVEMEVGKLQETKTLKRGREPGKLPGALDQPRIEVIGAGPASEPRKNQALGHDNIERDVFFQFEDSTALMGELRPVAGLSEEPPLEALNPKAKRERLA